MLSPHLRLRADASFPQGQPGDTAIKFRSPGGEPQAPADSAPQGQTAQQPAGGPPAGPGCGTEQLLMVGAMILIFYFLLIRPQQKQEKQRRTMLAALKRGDKVVTSGGIHGTVGKITDTTVQLRIDRDGKVEVTVDRGAIARVGESGDEAGKVAS